MTTNQQQIIEAIYGLLPELKQLEFGCKIQPFNNLRRLSPATLLSFNDTILEWFDNDKMTAKCSKCLIGDIKIIGLPITLHFIRKAIKNNPRILTGTMLERLFREVLKHWDLNKEDSLAVQLEANPELTRLLGNIFLKNNNLLPN